MALGASSHLEPGYQHSLSYERCPKLSPIHLLCFSHDGGCFTDQLLLYLHLVIASIGGHRCLPIHNGLSCRYCSESWWGEEGQLCYSYSICWELTAWSCFLDRCGTYWCLPCLWSPWLSVSPWSSMPISPIAILSVLEKKSCSGIF